MLNPPLRILDLSKLGDPHIGNTHQNINKLRKSEDWTSFSNFPPLLISPRECICTVTGNNLQENHVQLTGTDDLWVDFKLFEEQYNIFEGLEHSLRSHFLREIQLRIKRMVLYRQWIAAQQVCRCRLEYFTRCSFWTRRSVLRSQGRLSSCRLRLDASWGTWGHLRNHKTGWNGY